MSWRGLFGRPAARRRPPNAVRYTPGATGGHVESYFLRANDPVRPRAFWYKTTLLAPTHGPPVAEAWFIWFDAERGRATGSRVTVPLTEARVQDPADLQVADCHLRLDMPGELTGRMTLPVGLATWSLQFAPAPGPVGAPLSIFPSEALVEGPFPRSKPLTPFPHLHFTGRVTVDGEAVDINQWPGMQGHNWGREHAPEYAWGQCLFPARDGAPAAMVEGFSGRIRLGGRLSPRFSALVVRRGDATYRFDRIFDPWRQEAEVDFERYRWTVRLTGPAGICRVRMDAGARPLACLAYRNPDDTENSCINSKLAECVVEVWPDRGAPFVLQSEHGAALELLRAGRDLRFPDII